VAKYVFDSRHKMLVEEICALLGHNAASSGKEIRLLAA